MIYFIRSNIKQTFIYLSLAIFITHFMIYVNKPKAPIIGYYLGMQSSLFDIYSKLACAMYIVILLKYIGNYISYYFENIGYISVRYKTKEDSIKKFLSTIFILVGIFELLFLPITIYKDITLYNKVYNIGDILTIIIQAYIFICIYAILYLIMCVYFQNIQAIMYLLLIALGLTFINPLSMKIGFNLGSSINTVVYLSILIIEIIIFRKSFINRWGEFAN